ncbi:MAG: hypothetical protein JNL75_10490 [Chitinophagales bacterium]|nr:hypothetical protein [Chitinophagales bacterium]
MNILGLFCLFSLTANYVAGQTSTIDIEYSDLAELTINTKKIDGKTNVNALIENLGKPSKIEDYPSGEKSYFYEEFGIVFFTSKGQIKELGINYNWDGDKKFPEQAFKGTLKIGGTEITGETVSESIAGIESIKFVCPMPMICASENQNVKTNCLIAFKDKKLTQVTFLIK